MFLLCIRARLLVVPGVSTFGTASGCVILTLSLRSGRIHGMCGCEIIYQFLPGCHALGFVSREVWKRECLRAGFTFWSEGLEPYAGVTSKLSQRVLEHKRGIKSGFASKYHCDRLAYFEEYGDIRSAIAREKTIKGWTRAKKIALIESLNPEWKDLAQYWGSPTLVPGQSMQEENDRQRRRIQLPMDSSLRSE